LFASLISHQPAALFSQNKSATSNQPAVLFSQNKPAPAISHQPNEQADHFSHLASQFIIFWIQVTKGALHIGIDTSLINWGKS
jgi:hypothetical protein